MSADNQSGSGANSADNWQAPSTVQSVSDIQSQNNAAAQAEMQALNSGGGFFDNILNIGPDAAIQAAAQQRTSAYTQQQYQQLSGDVETQSAPSFGSHNYSSYSASQLKQMITTNNDPSSVGESSSGWTSLGNQYVDTAQALGQAASSSEAGWQGSAGDATRDFMMGMAKWAGTAGQGAQLAGNRLAVQSEAASTAKNSVPANPAEPPSTGDIVSTMLDNAFNPAAGAAKLNQQFAQAQADHNEAVQAAQTYDSSLASSGEKFPAFSAPPTFNPNAGGGTVSTPTGGTGVTGLHAGSTVPHAGTGAGGGGGSVRTGSSSYSGGSSGVNAPPTPGSPSGSTGTSGFESGPGFSGPTNIGSSGPGQFSGGNGPNWNGNSLDPTFSGSLLGADTGGAGGGFGGGAGGAGGGFGGGAGSGLGSARGLSGAGGSEGGSSSGASSRSGAGSGAAAEESEGGVGSSAAKAASGESEGGSMPRGGSSKGGGQDSEHKRASYLLNDDPDATFGTDERVAPPVIGE